LGDTCLAIHLAIRVPCCSHPTEQKRKRFRDRSLPLRSVLMAVFDVFWTARAHCPVLFTPHHTHPIMTLYGLLCPFHSLGLYSIRGSRTSFLLALWLKYRHPPSSFVSSSSLSICPLHKPGMGFLPQITALCRATAVKV
jgi:hypothetical protein